MLRHVPISVRTFVGDELCNLLNDFCYTDIDSNRVHGLALIFMFPACILFRPPQHASQEPLAAQIRKRLGLWREGAHMDLWTDARGASFPTSRSSSTGNPAKRALALAGEGAFSRALKALQSEGIHDATPEIWEKLLSKHPQERAAPDSFFDSPAVESDFPPPPPHKAFSPDEVRSMLENTLPASSPGGSGLSFDHLRELTRSETVTQPHQGLTAALARFADCFASSPMPPAAASGLAGAPLTPLRKEVTDVRPIAVGETLRRLTGKLLKNRAREKAGTLLAPRQLGVSVSGGAEALIHSLHRLHTEFGKQSEVAILQVDFANAFNLISRRAMFCAVRTHFPELLQYVETCYGDNTDPVLWCQDLQLYSRTGCQQSDPLGPLLFSITLHDFLSHAPKEVRANEAGGADISRIPMWYLDDGYIFGRHESLQQYTSFLDSPLARRYGLYLKLDGPG